MVYSTLHKTSVSFNQNLLSLSSPVDTTILWYSRPRKSLVSYSIKNVPSLLSPVVNTILWYTGPWSTVACYLKKIESRNELYIYVV